MTKKTAMERKIYLGERDIQLVCPICGGKKFFKRATLMNTAGMTFLDLDWANPEATNFICEDCTYIYWFLEDPETKRPTDKPLTRAEEYEISFDKLSNEKLYKILEGKSYNDDAKTAAKNLLRRRKMPL